MTLRTIIGVPQLSELMASADVLILDCRFDLADPGAGHSAYLSGHIAGARYVDLEQDLSAAPDGSNGRHPLPDRHGFAERMAAVGMSRDRPVVGYDASGGFYASRLWWMLRWAGHDDVAVLDGGIAAWRTAGMDLVSGQEVAVSAGDFTASAEPRMPIVELPTIQTNIRAGGLLVIDARTAERFRGEPHPLDPVSGHIPGARNRFFQDNLTAEGYFKSPAALAKEFGSILGDRAACEIVHQCGSGVTATHNLLAMELAGLQGSRLYPGSWSEWVSHPARAVATGEA